MTSASAISTHSSSSATKSEAPRSKRSLWFTTSPPARSSRARAVASRRRKIWKEKKLGAPARDAAFAQWPIFVQTTGIDARKVTIVDVGFAAREPILASGQVDAITGFSFSSYFTLKDRGVPVDDIVVMLMGDYGLKLYSNAIILNANFG